MNVTIESPDATAPSLSFPTVRQRTPADVGIRIQPQAALPQSSQPLKRSASTGFAARPAYQQPAMQVPPQAPPPPPKEVVQTFSDFANPAKQMPMKAPSAVSFGSEDDFTDDEDGGGPQNNNPGLDEEDDFEDLAGDYPAGADDDDEGYEAQDPLKPSEGFKTLEEERTDILCKLNRLKRQGLSGLRSFGFNSDIREMRAELNRVRTELDMEASVKWQRKILMACVSTMEFANRKWNPFDLQLNGWSEQVMESITDYDRCFERLFYKYRSKVSMPPEAELLLMVGSSAFMFHLTNSMFKSQNMLQNPQFMQQMAQAMAQAQANNNTAAPAPAPQQQPQDAPQPSSSQPQEGAGGGSQRREIRGPGMDFSSFLGGGLPSMTMPPPQPSRSAPPPSPGQQPSNPPQQQARSRKRPPSVVSSDEGDFEDDRVSDIISEDLASVPDDLTSPSGSEDESGLKTVTITTGRGRGRKRANTTKKVMMI